MVIQVEQAGMLTTIQDLGRTGYRHLGFAQSGAMDQLAATVANLLLDQNPNTPLLEFTLVGPKLRFEADAVFALTGADVNAKIDDRVLDTIRTQVFSIQAGQILTIGAVKQGCRGYLGIKGGIRGFEQLGSASTQINVAFGGYQGRALAKGDSLKLSTQTPKCPSSLASLLAHVQHRSIHLLPGPQASWFEHSMTTLCSQPYSLTNASDRMGFRLNGTPLTRAHQQELRTEGAVPGSVQIPADGQPIILMSDSQPTGGYPKPAVVASVDLSVLAQLKPGDQISFQSTTYAEARATLLWQQKQLNQLAIAAKYRWKEL